MYQAQKLSRSVYVPVRQLRYHVRVWGEPDPAQPPLVLLHGWMDVAASWQFMVDALSQPRWIVAPDWRGFGESRPSGPAPDCYWFPDYLADLDVLLDQLCPDQPVDLVGHSMGGNVAMVYGGVRPQRIRRLVNLEGFGLPATRPAQAPGRLAQWMDEVKALPQGAQALKTYPSVEAVAARLMKNNPRLSPDKAQWLAPHWAAPNAQGQWEILGDAAHKVVSAYLYRVDETLELYRRISAPVLAVTASDDSLSQWWPGRFTLAEHQARLRAVPQVQHDVVADSGHMLHHDQPKALAQMLEAFWVG
ncbi:MAG: hypothetical protein RLZZ352_797 [Pseudomonadota bacterium]|jgi:pimeloyl-ACP methyl ester carboxylesterase